VADSTRDDQIAALYPLLTMEQIGKRFGVSRQRVHQILRKRGYIAFGGNRMVPVAMRFWPRVAFGDGCWEWQGSRVSNGYGHINGIGNGYAHRAAWELTYGPIPDGLQVLHRCDNPPCVRLDHLFIGTTLDNMRDRDAKGRGRGGPNRPSLQKSA
jgi:hypothetical protein